MSGFGDFEPDDSFALSDTDPDPEAVARIFLALLLRASQDPERTEDALVVAFRLLLRRLQREGVA